LAILPLSLSVLFYNTATIECSGKENESKD